MKFLRKTIKIATLCFSYVCGGFRKSGPIILMYHSVGGFKSKHSIDPDIFEKQIRYIVSKRSVISLVDLVAILRARKPLPERSVVLSFDDGYRDTFEVLLPILSKYSVPATLFLTTNLSEMETMANIPRPSKEQVRLLSQSSLVSIEAHGHNHKNLTLLSTEELRFEISQNKDAITDLAGHKARFFAYPYGYKNESVVSFISQQFEAAFGIREGSVSLEDSLFTLPRVQVDRTVTFFEFALRLTKAVDINRKIVNYLRSIWRSKK